MELAWLADTLEAYGEGPVLFATALAIGVVFGAAAQRSQFCMRAATVEVAERQFGPRLLVWLLVFAVAVFLTQAFVAGGLIDVSGARQLAATGSISGAIIGGALFGIGMILARGCASRLLVLSATGNLRAIVTGLVLTLSAQAALSGVLSPLRLSLASLWTIDGGAARNLTQILGLPVGVMPVLALVGGVGLMIYAVHKRLLPVSKLLATLLVGAAVAAGWIATAAIAAASFEIVPITSLTFTGPSSDTLMALVANSAVPMTFAVGLVPGVALGSALAAIASREFVIQRFGSDTPMERYLFGAVLMGFGSMLAGGCAVGAVLSGGAIMAVTGLLAGVAMWGGAMATHLLLKARRTGSAAPAV